MYTNTKRANRREKMGIKIKIVKDTFNSSKNCWFIKDVEKGFKWNYFGFPSKKKAIEVAEDSNCEIVK
tara:strand:- start:325 stop:528 length:204 start_codon:yes stop_codon:yes gene_type:complete